MKDAVIHEKEHEINRLRKELFVPHHHKTGTNPSFWPDIKQLLETVEQLTKENTILKQKLNQSSNSGAESGKGEQPAENNKSDIYSQIHNKIDILKISIDKKGQESSSDEPSRDSRIAKLGKAKFYKWLVILKQSIYNVYMSGNTKRTPSSLAKVVVIGDSGVGKTNLITKYCDGVFKESYVATIGVDFKLKTVNVGNELVKLQIWDTAGQ